MGFLKHILAEGGAPAKGLQSAVGALKKDPGKEMQEGMGKGQQSQVQVVLNAAYCQLDAPTGQPTTEMSLLGGFCSA